MGAVASAVGVQATLLGGASICAGFGAVMWFRAHRVTD
jgi:hypothetical protein